MRNAFRLLALMTSSHVTLTHELYDLVLMYCSNVTIVGLLCSIVQCLMCSLLTSDSCVCGVRMKPLKPHSSNVNFTL